jgi:microcystin-dependent protein
MAHNIVNPVNIVDSTDNTKKVKLDPSGATTGTTATISTNQTADRTYSIPDSGGNSAFVMTEGTQTINGTKTFNGSLLIKESSGSDAITIQAPALASSYSLTLPVDDGTSNNQVLTTDGAGVLSWQSMLPAGITLPFAGNSTPTGFLLCDGSAVSRTTYANLFAAIGVLWGVGDGSTTFNLPNLQRRVIAGSGGTSTGTLGNTVGSVGGAETLPAHDHTSGTLTNSTSSVSGTINSGGAHTHTFTTGTESVKHTHTQPSSAQGGGSGGTGASSALAGSVFASGNGYVLNAPNDGGSPGYVESSENNQGHTHSGTTDSNGSHTHTFTLNAAAQTISGSTGSTGTGSHGVIQPTAVMNYIIKY